MQAFEAIKSFPMIKVFIINEAFIAVSIVGHCAILSMFTLHLCLLF
jgi:hypothetical protein